MINLEHPLARWRKDLARDIRYSDDRDNLDMNMGVFSEVPDRHIEVRHPEEGYIVTMTRCNLQALSDHYALVADGCRAILEIGVDHNSTPTAMTSTNFFLNNKKKSTVYLGVDINDKSYLDDPENNVYTIRADSSNIDAVMNKARAIRVSQFDFIFIDGWHSINQVMKEWEYTAWLSDRGVVGMHDTSVHPGPNLFMKNLDRSQWNVVENSCALDSNDFGIGFAWKKSKN